MADQLSPALAPRSAGWLVAAVSLVVFAPSLWDGFVYDDLPLIVDNPAAHELRHLLRNFTTHLWDVEHFQDSSRFNRYYRPLVSSSYTLNWVLGGGRAWVFHLTNIVMHAAAALLATRLATFWTRSASLGMVAGLLFALHPTRSENVTWISGRTDVMMALFGFAAVWLFVRGAKSPKPGGWFASATVCLVGSVLSKEGGMMMPLLVGVSALVLPAGSERRRLSKAALFTGIACAGYFVARMTLYPVRKGLGSVVPKYFLLTVQAYVERTLLPWPQVFFYRPLQIGPEGYDVSVWVMLGAVVAIALSCLLLMVAWRRSKAAFVLVVAAFAFIGPLLNLTYVGIGSTSSDRFLYLPHFCLASGLLVLWRSQALAVTRQRLVALAGVGVLLVFAALQWLRVADYRSDTTFWTHELEHNPHFPLALAAVSRLRAEQGETAEAYRLLKSALGPVSARYAIAQSERRVSKGYLDLLPLKAALLADGRVADLQLLFSELDRVMQLQTEPVHGEVDDLRVGFALKADTMAELVERQNVKLSAEVALLATRIGKHRRARALLANVRGPADVDKAPNVPNLALAFARTGDFKRAKWTLAQGRKLVATRGELSDAVLDEVGARIDRAALLSARAAQAPKGPMRALLRAQSQAELGAYFVALTLLQPHVAKAPASSGARPLFLQLLVAARLEDEARAFATDQLGKQRGASTVDTIRAQLPETVRSLAPAPGRVKWRR